MAAKTKKPRREESIGDDPTRRVRELPATSPHGEDAQDRTRQIIEYAIRQGTHGLGCGHFCTGCRTMVPAILWGESASKTELCEKCYEGIKGSAAAIDAIAFIKSKSAKPYEPSFEDALLWWAKDHFTEAFRAFCQSRSADWEQRVLASIVRRRAERERGWLNTVIEGKWFHDLLRMAGRVVKAGGYPILPGQSFADAIKRVRECPV